HGRRRRAAVRLRRRACEAARRARRARLRQYGGVRNLAFARHGLREGCGFWAQAVIRNAEFRMQTLPSVRASLSAFCILNSALLASVTHGTREQSSTA